MYIIAGLGRQGKAIVHFLKQASDVEIVSYDPYVPPFTDGNHTHHDMCWKVPKANNRREIVFISTLRPEQNLDAADACVTAGIHYVDLGGTVEVTNKIAVLSHQADCTLVPDCGLAPGIVSSWAGTQWRRGFRTIEMYCGGLPRCAPPDDCDHKHLITFSAKGLWAEYQGVVSIARNGELVQVPALSGLTTTEVDGELFEAAYTSGSLSNTVELRGMYVQSLFYKTLRYPGHYAWLKDNVVWQEDPATVLQACLPEGEDDKILLSLRTESTREDYKWVADPTTGFTAMTQATGYITGAVAKLVRQRRVRHGMVAMHDISFLSIKDMVNETIQGPGRFQLIKGE